MSNPVSIVRRMKNQFMVFDLKSIEALSPLKTCISMYFIPDVLSFCIASVFIFISLSCSGLVTLSTQLWREVSLLSRLLYNAHSALSLNRLRKLC